MPNNGTIGVCCAGQDYYKAVARAMLAAQETIFISSEMISPEMYLIREGGVLQE